MTLHKIKSVQRKDKYVLLAKVTYHTLKDQIGKELTAFKTNKDAEHTKESCVLEDYVDNPVDLTRIKAGIAEEKLVRQLGLSQALMNVLILENCNRF